MFISPACKHHEPVWEKIGPGPEQTLKSFWAGLSRPNLGLANDIHFSFLRGKLICARETKRVSHPHSRTPCLAICGTHVTLNLSVTRQSPSPASPHFPPPPLLPCPLESQSNPSRSQSKSVGFRLFAHIDGDSQSSPLPEAVHRARAHQQVRRQAGKQIPISLLRLHSSQISHLY